jgi:hypothetical protein
MTGVTILLTIAASIAALFTVAAYAHDSRSGAAVAPILLIPILLSVGVIGGVIVRRACAIAMLLIVFISSFSIGLFYLPSAVLMLYQAARPAPQDQPARPIV